MPRYFFDTDDGQTRYHDDEGTDLANEDAACEEARGAISEFAKDFIPMDGTAANITMVVRDDDDTAILQLTLTFRANRLATRPSADR
jgi:hypothetical protein